MRNLDLMAKSIGAKVVDDSQPVDNQPNQPEAQNVEQPQDAIEQPEKQETESSLQAESNSTDEPKSRDIDEVIKERFEGKFSSLEDIQKALEESKPSEVKYANETIEQLDKMAREGWSVEEYLEIKSKDYDSISDEEVIKQNMLAEDRTLTREDVDLLYESEFGYDEDVDSERDIKLRQIKLKKEASKARDYMKDIQQKYQPKAVQQQANIQDLKKRWSETIDSVSINEIKSGDSFKYEVSQDDLKAAKSDVQDLSSYFNRYVNEDGSDNVQKLIEDQLKIKLFDKAVSAAMTSAKSQGREEVISNRDNVQPTKESRPEGSKTMGQQLWEQAKQKGFF